MNANYTLVIKEMEMMQNRMLVISAENISTR